MSRLPTDQQELEPNPVSVRVAERELALEDLTYLNRMTTVGQVLPNVAHEVNNALQVVSGLVEMLSLRQDLPADVCDKVARIGTQSSRATELMRALVTFARRDDGGVGVVDVAKAVDRSLAFRRYHLGRARIAVVTEGCHPGQALVRADGHLVQQVLINLLINAEHSLSGRLDGRIHVLVTRSRDVVEVRVADNGPGIPVDMASRVTEPFFTTREVAAGLGLTVARALARQQGGDLQFEPGAEGGTLAILALPALP